MKCRIICMLLTVVVMCINCSTTKPGKVKLKRKLRHEYEFVLNKQEFSKKENLLITGYVKLCESNIKKIKKNYSKADYNDVLEYVREIEQINDKIKQYIAVDDYFGEALLYKGMILENKLKFDDAKKIYKTISELSKFHALAKDRIYRIENDSDGDGFTDAVEIQLKTSYNNPLSHP